MNLFTRPLTVKRPRLNMLEAGDIIQILKPRAEEKLIQLTEIVTSPKADNWLKKITVTLIISLGAMVLIGVVVGVMR